MVQAGGVEGAEGGLGAAGEEGEGWERERAEGVRDRGRLSIGRSVSTQAGSVPVQNPIVVEVVDDGADEEEGEEDVDGPIAVPDGLGPRLL